MRKATLKGLLAHKLRLALTALSVVLGVAFVSGTFVLTDTINHTFDNLFTEVSQGVDVTVRARSGAEVLGFLRDSVRELGQTVVMVTHDPVAAAYADRVVLLADGRIAGDIDRPDRASVAAALQDLAAGR